MNGAAALDPSPSSHDVGNLDDIFDHDDPESSMDEDDEEYDDAVVAIDEKDSNGAKIGT